jgi:hypothetical protein
MSDFEEFLEKIKSLQIGPSSVSKSQPCPHCGGNHPPPHVIAGALVLTRRGRDAIKRREAEKEEQSFAL